MKLDVAHATVLDHGEGEVITERPERTLRLKVGIDAIAVTETRYEPGERGPDAHVHHRHTDAFYVLEGTMLYELGADRTAVEARAGSFVAAPPDLVHSFRNDGPDRARFLNFHAPSERFHDYLRASYAGDDVSWFDQHDPPPDGGRPLSDAVIATLSEHEPIDVGGALFVADTTVAPGFGGPSPARDGERVYALLYVLDGTLSLRVDGDEIDAPPGTFACVPPGRDHAIENRGDSPARLLSVHVPV
jgi:quercetin dioxygenase-like cupin family protein